MPRVGDTRRTAVALVQAHMAPCGQTRCYQTFGATPVNIRRFVANASTTSPLRLAVHDFRSAGTMRAGFSLSQSVRSLSQLKKGKEAWRIRRILPSYRGEAAQIVMGLLAYRGCDANFSCCWMRECIRSD